MQNKKWFQKYDEAAEAAKSAGAPFWDTHSQPHRYMVGHLAIEEEDDPGNEEWEQLDPNED